MFLADVLFNASRLRFTRRQKRAILSFARQCGGVDVPALSALRKFQNSLNQKVGNPTSRYVSSLGNIFYLNEIGQSLAKVCYIMQLARAHLDEAKQLIHRTWPILALARQ
jgi:hypothetical protein